VSAPRREGPGPPAHLTCPITNEVSTSQGYVS
jgi:hypothetical protein